MYFSIIKLPIDSTIFLNVYSPLVIHLLDADHGQKQGFHSDRHSQLPVSRDLRGTALQSEQRYLVLGMHPLWTLFVTPSFPSWDTASSDSGDHERRLSAHPGTLLGTTEEASGPTAPSDSEQKAFDCWDSGNAAGDWADVTSDHWHGLVALSQTPQACHSEDFAQTECHAEYEYVVVKKRTHTYVQGGKGVVHPPGSDPVRDPHPLSIFRGSDPLSNFWSVAPHHSERFKIFLHGRRLKLMKFWW